MSKIIIQIRGDSGDGMQLVGEQLTLSAAVAGKEARSLPDFPAEIRAPAGTVFGVSGLQLAIADIPLYTSDGEADILVALNPAALVSGITYLKPNALIIINEDSFTKKDWQKAGLEISLETLNCLKIPLIELTCTALKETSLTFAQQKKCKNFYILGVILWMFDSSLDFSMQFITNKFKTDEKLLLANQIALQAGFNYALTLELPQNLRVNKVMRPKGDYRQINGVEALTLALATIASKSSTELLVAGYPITPASAFLEEAVKLQAFGISLFQAEDEIAAICACLGAAFGGKLAITFTSGPGLDLKSEAMGLAIMAELPLVIVDVQRAGVSTGLPTKTSQSDLNQALYGRHGNAQLPVIAALSPADCFDATISAFKIAIKYTTPVILLLDATLANAAQPWKIPDPKLIDIIKPEFNKFPNAFSRDENLARSWNIPGTAGHIYQTGGLEKDKLTGKVSYDSKNHQEMTRLRAKKIAKVACEYPPLKIDGNIKADTILIGWGSTYGSLKEVVESCDYLALLHCKFLFPHHKNLSTILKNYKNVFVAELNTGHFCDLLRSKYLIDAKKINKYDGQPFTKKYIFDALGELLDECIKLQEE